MGRPSAAKQILTAAALACALVSCTGGEEHGQRGLGKLVHSGGARALKASPSGAWLAFLESCGDVRGQFLPPQTANCELRVVASGGGDVRRVATAVTTLPHGFAWAPSSDVLAAVAEYDYVQAAGTLVLAEGGGAPVKVAEGVTFHGFGPSAGGVVAVAQGKPLASAPGRAPAWFDGVDGVSALDVTPAATRGDGVTHLFRRPARLGGALLAKRDGKPGVVQLATSAGDFAFARGGAYAFTAQAGDGYELRVGNGARPPAAVGRKVHSFAFSRDGAAIAFVGEAEPGRQGNLHAARLGAGDVVLARDVGEYRWAAAAPRLAWLERYDPRVRAGTLGAGALDGPPRTFATNVTDFELSSDGRHVAWLAHTTRGGYSVDLGLGHLDGPAGAKGETVANGVFGFAFSPDGRWLYYRTRCTRNAEACDLERVPAAGLAPGAKPEAIAQAVKSFEFDPRDPERLLVAWQRMDMVALDVGVFDRGRLTSVDTAVLPGSAQFLGPDSRRLAYVVVHPKRQGVYVAELPR